MRRVLIIFMFFTFAIGSSGFSKTVNAQHLLDSQSVSISQFKTSSSSNDTLTKCCSNEDENSQNLKPRCVGDMSISACMHVNTNNGSGYKLSVYILPYTGIIINTRFLRPPIA